MILLLRLLFLLSITLAQYSLFQTIPVSGNNYDALSISGDSQYIYAKTASSASIYQYLNDTYQLKQSLTGLNASSNMNFVPDNNGSIIVSYLYSYALFDSSFNYTAFQILQNYDFTTVTANGLKWIAHHSSSYVTMFSRGDVYDLFRFQSESRNFVSMTIYDSVANFDGSIIALPTDDNVYVFGQNWKEKCTFYHGIPRISFSTLYIKATADLSMIVVYRLNSNNTVYRFNFFYISEGESNYTLKQELKFVSTEPLKDATLDSDHLIIVLSNYTRVLKAVNGQYVDVQNITDKNFTVAAARNGTLVATDRKNHYIYKATVEFERSHGEELAE